MQEKEIAGIVRRQKAYFAEGRTLPVPCRLAALGRLERSVRAHQEDIAAALQADLGKSPQESYMCETGPDPGRAAGPPRPICAAGRSPGYVWPGRPTFRGWRPGCPNPMGWH